VVVVLPAALTSFYVGAALAGMSFPLFVIVAADCDVKEAYRRGAHGRMVWGYSRGRRLHNVARSVVQA
jgi:hypothetical protein